MLESFVQRLDQIGSATFWTCLVLLVAVNATAAAIVMITRSRTFVNRWTGRVLGANILLVGAGAGVPAATYAIKLVAEAVAPMVRDRVPTDRISAEPETQK